MESPANSTSDDGYYHADTYSYEYYYDYNESVNNIPLEELVPVTLTYSLTLLLGLVGNCLVIFSISYYRKMRTVTNVFLLSLASADLLLVLVCVPIKAAAFFAYTWQFGEVLCKLVNYVQNYSMVCSVLTLTVISMERVVAVVFPLQAMYLCTMRHAQLVVVGVWVLSAALTVPTLFIFVHMEVGEVRKGFWCIKNYGEQGWMMTYELYMLTLLFVIPLLVMVLAYSVIAVKVWRVSDIRAAGRVIAPPTELNRRRSDFRMENGGGHRPLLSKIESRVRVRQMRFVKQMPEERETRRQVVGMPCTGVSRPGCRDVMHCVTLTLQVVGMLVTVVLLFVLCWAPILTNNVLTAWGHLHHLNYGYLKPMRQAFFLLSYFNSCLNPAIYAFFSHNFRQSFKLAICACLRGKAFVRAYRYSLSVASTRASSARFQSPVTPDGRGVGVGPEGSGVAGLSSLFERDTTTSTWGAAGGSSENDTTRSPTSYSCSSPEVLELYKLSP
ncbi:somatostatin receptor type 5-like [Babylonia areolata]|uniref:somatostatin receptor type 5-like n=1 Tax=Babylonia areolata TaxID=304850 RepID=UPI003FD1FA63